MALPYELTKQFPYKLEEVFAKFAHEKDAVDFMHYRLDRDHKTKVEVTYRLYHGSDPISEIEASKYEPIATTDSVGTGKRFSPTPLATVPKPAGSPQNSREDDDELI